MRLIVGLGNPGSEYDKTRHNMGFMFIDSYLSYLGITDKWSNKFNGLYIKTRVDDNDVIFLKPQTMMNNSGFCVKKFVDYFKIDISDVLVICDDMDLRVGNFKLKNKGSCGGHNGLRSIENSLGSSYYKRLRIGISKSGNNNVIDYVLGRFSNDDLDIYKKLFNDLYKVIDDYLVMDFNSLMNKYNRKNR